MRKYLLATAALVAWSTTSFADVFFTSVFNPPASVQLGQPVSLDMTFTVRDDPPFTDAQFQSGTVTVNWGDGSLPNQVFVSSGTTFGIEFFHLPSLVADLVRRRVAVIFSTGGDVPTLVAKGATTTIPIVFATGADPLRSGLVASLNRPGGNATGATVVAGLLGAKRIAVLRELTPNTHALGLLVNPNNPNAEPETADIEAAVQSMHAQVQVLPASNGEEVEAAFAVLANSKLDGLVVNPDPIFFPRRDQIVALAARQAVPTIYYSREYAEAGGLMSYGASFTWLYRQCGIYVARILKGAKPTDLPVVQPTRFELVINAKTAKTLGLTVPPTLVATADEVIE
jgi:putative tryptophan/tyrosine transport system substrate-binding protein